MFDFLPETFHFAASGWLWAIAALPVTDEIGFALAVLSIGLHWWRTRRPVAAGA